jgi:hypothetical protein
MALSDALGRSGHRLDTEATSDTTHSTRSTVPEDKS